MVFNILNFETLGKMIFYYKTIMVFLTIETTLYSEGTSFIDFNSFFSSLDDSFFQNSSYVPVRSSCDIFIEEFGSSVANFTTCVVLHSRPFSVCMSCYPQYLQCKSIYDILLKTTDGTRGSSCADKIAHTDYVQMIVKVHDFIEDSWTSNYCSGCYAGNGSTEHANSTKEFLSRLNLFNQCIFDKLADHIPYIIPGKLPVNKTICDTCSSSYKNLSDYYSMLDPNFDGHFCMDLSDSMNFTWNLWHENFKCPARAPVTDVCISTSFAILVLPVLFYLLAKICSGNITKIFLREKRLQSDLSFSSSPQNDVTVQ